MACVIFGGQLENVNGSLVSSGNRAFAERNHAGLGDLLRQGWLLRSLKPIRLLHVKTRARKTLDISDRGSKPASSTAAVKGKSTASIQEQPPQLCDRDLDDLLRSLMASAQDWNRIPHSDVVEGDRQTSPEKKPPPKKVGIPSERLYPSARKTQSRQDPAPVEEEAAVDVPAEETPTPEQPQLLDDGEDVDV
jgi:hypothetical protein